MTLQITLLILTVTSVVKLTKTELTGFIVRGYFSKIEVYPYSVFVSINCNGKNSSCGASILNQALLLTAAHCVYKCKNKFTINAYTGSKTRYKGFENNVVSFRIHEEYNDGSKANDIALLKLENFLTFSSKVKRIALMKKPPKYDDAVVAGWGWIDFIHTQSKNGPRGTVPRILAVFPLLSYVLAESVGTKSNVLKHASQQVYSRMTCIKILKRIPDGTICGRDLEGLSYPERGDSGSALVIHNFIQIGIVSFKKRSYTNDTIVYTDVPYYYDWIKQNAKEMYCDGHGQKIVGRKERG